MIQSQFAASAFATVLLGALLAPAAQNWASKPVDSFPLSYYPMFSFQRESTYTSQFLTGIGKDGKRHKLSYELAGSGGFNQIRRQIREKVKRGEAQALCAKIAKRAARRQSGIETVEISTGKFDIDSYFAGRKEPLTRKVNATCPVFATSSQRSTSK